MPNTRLSRLGDTQLLARLAQPDVAAFETLYDRHISLAFSLAFRITKQQGSAEEATQDAFMSLWRSADRYDPRRGTPKSWLLAMVRNRAIDLVRRRDRQAPVAPMADADAHEVESPDRTDQEVLQRSGAEHMQQLLGALPAAQQQALRLGYFDGLSQREIAKRLALPIGTIKSRQRLGLTRLHSALTAG